MKIKVVHKNKDHILLAILFHIGLGIIAFIFRSIMMFYLIVIIFYFFKRIVTAAPKEKLVQVLIACAYVTGSEVFFRMTKAYFLYETGKYLVILFVIIGFFYDGFKRKAIVFVSLLILLLPAIFVSSQELGYNVDFRKAVMFNLSGPICLIFISIYIYGKSITYKDYLSVLNYIVYPLISMTTFIILYNPDIRDIVTNTAANSAASGGYGPNQVATALGLGIFILFSRLIITYKNKFVQLLMIIFLAVMIYRGILTFSRGGILTAIIMSLIFIVIYFIYSKITLKFKLLVKLIGVLSMISLIWVISVNQSGGLIENRYANEDSLGREKDDITTGRLDIFITELDSFYKQPFFGVGVGKMKYIRLKETGINAASHNEFSRMLSEHGLFGIISLIILLLVPILNNPFGLKNIYFYPFLFFWILTISHSAMRIAAPAFIYGLCLLTITREKKNFIHRK
jgi:hypothetical protein